MVIPSILEAIDIENYSAPLNKITFITGTNWINLALNWNINKKNELRMFPIIHINIKEHASPQRSRIQIRIFPKLFLLLLSCFIFILMGCLLVQSIIARDTIYIIGFSLVLIIMYGLTVRTFNILVYKYLYFFENIFLNNKLTHDT